MKKAIYLLSIFLMLLLVGCPESTVPVGEVKLDKTELSLTEGESEILTAVIVPDNASNKAVKWSSSDDKVASVDESGKVTALSAGKATIKVVSDDGAKEATLSLVVKAKFISVSSITLDKKTLNLKVGEKQTLVATVAPENATDKSVTWSSDNTDVVTVDDKGKVEAKKLGEANITVMTADGSFKATCNVSVVPTPVEGITLNETEVSIFVGNTFDLNETVSPASATDKSVTWTTSDDKVATVDADGLVEAEKVGEATITATTKDGSFAASAKITVKPTSVTGVSLNKETVDMIIGSTFDLDETIAPDDATNKSVKWSSSDDNIASVGGNGLVTAVSVGKATITVTTIDGERTAKCVVTVNPILVTGVTIDKTNLELYVGDSFDLTETVEPSNATDKTVTWTTSDDKVATVDAKGLVEAIKVGTATIKVTTTDREKIAECTVNVKPILVSGVAIDKTNLELYVGDSFDFTETVEPSNATDKTVTWTTSDDKVATVDVKGLVEAKKIGTATITVTTADGKHSATCAVKVDPVIVTGITLPATAGVDVGKTIKLDAVIAPDNATNKNISWKSDDERIATVDHDGNVVGVYPGKATITATTEDGAKTASTKVTVSGIWADDLIYLYHGISEYIYIDTDFGIWPSSVPSAEWSFKVGNPDIADSYDYLKGYNCIYLSGLSLGETDITLTYGDYSKTIRIEVLPYAYFWDKDFSKVLPVGKSIDISKSIYLDPSSSGPIETIEFTSSDPSVVSVENGVLTAHKDSGSADISFKVNGKFNGVLTVTTEKLMTSMTIADDVIISNEDWSPLLTSVPEGIGLANIKFSIDPGLFGIEDGKAVYNSGVSGDAVLSATYAFDEKIKCTANVKYLSFGTIGSVSDGMMLGGFNCKGIADKFAITIPDYYNGMDNKTKGNITEIADMCFSGLADYATTTKEFTLELPSTIKRIGNYGLDTADIAGNNAVKSVTVSSALESVGEEAFKSANIENVSFADGAIIGDSAFAYSKLKTVTFNGSATIGECAFEDVQVAELVIPAGSKVGAYAFSSPQLKKVFVAEDVKFIPNADDEYKPFHGGDAGVDVYFAMAEPASGEMPWLDDMLLSKCRCHFGQTWEAFEAGTPIPETPAP